MSFLERLLFGQAEFAAGDEYRAFQFRFLCIVLPIGAVVTALLVAGVLAGANPIDSRHVLSMCCFTLLSVVLWLLLRGRPERFLALAWPYELVCLAEYVSALYFVSEDEMRVIWFFTNIPGVYILLGQTAGMAVTVLSIVGLALGNGFLPHPYSSNAMATLLAALAYVGVFFHVYGKRSLSYFAGMRESNRQLRHLASHDPLTGLLNARAYYAACDQLIRLAARYGGSCAVLFVDLDHFKSINDTHGHEAGDMVLRRVAETLQETLRRSDAIGRVGGEEFSIFLPNTDPAGALTLAETVRAAIEQLMPPVGAGRLRVTASIGVACDPCGELTMAAIQGQADQAMYVAKRQGRNRVSVIETPKQAA